MNIGDRIKKRRLELRMSQEELAQKLGYKSRSSINKIELGHENLTQRKIKAIADALETTPAYIMGWELEMETSVERQQINDLLDSHKDDIELHKHILEYAKFLLSQMRN